MSMFDDMGATAMLALKHVYGETVTYAGTAITAVVQRMDESLEDGEYTRQTVARATLVISLDTVTAPAIGDAVVFDSATWYVVSVTNTLHGTCASLDVVREDRSHVGQPDAWDGR